MNFEYSPYILPLIAATLVSLTVSIYAWTRRSANGALALFLLAVSISVWTIGYVLEIAGTNLETKYVWGVIQYVGIAFAPYSWLIFSISYGDLSKILTRRFIILTAITPSITVLLALTTKWHGLIWSEYHIEWQSDFSALGVTHGAWFLVHLAYSYISLLAGTILLIRVLLRRQGMYRGQIAAMLVAVLTPWVGNALYLTGNSPIPYLDLTPFAFTVTVAALAWAIFGFHLVDITPLARDLIIDSMQDGMIVLNIRGNVVDINNAAARMIGVPVVNAIGKAAGDVFSPWPHLIERFRDVSEANEVIAVGAGKAIRSYEVRFSPLKDSQDQIAGRVIMLRLLDETTSFQPKSTPKDTVPRSYPKLVAQPQPESKRNIISWLKDFFLAPVNVNLEIPADTNPSWFQARERSFTIITRIAALIGTIAYFLTLPFVRSSTLSSINITYGTIIGILWLLGLSRNMNFRYRAVLFLSLVYALGFVETQNFGYSVESFVFFLTFILTSVVLTGRTGGWLSAGISFVTLFIFNWLISKSNFVPYNSTVNTILPRSFEMGLTSLFVFSASVLAISASIIILMESLNSAWQSELQTSNLLEQERDLLEQRVEERTHDLADARDSAIRGNTELRKYYRAIEQSGNGIVITDVNGNIEYANPKFEEFTGYALEEVLGKNPRILKSGRQRPEFYEKLWKTIGAGEVWHGVFHNKKKDGSLYWESATVAPVLDPNGAVLNYVAIKEDITARRQAEEQLRKLSQAVEQSGNTVIIMDKNGMIEYVNPKFSEVTGYSSEDALGKSPISLMNRLDVVPDFSQHEWWLTVNAGLIWRGEFRNHRKDGSVFWESATIAPVHNREGEAINFVEIKQDITEEKIMQDQLQKQNDYLSILHQVTLDLLNRRDLNDLLQVIVDRSAVLLDAPFSELMLEKDDILMVEAFTDNQSSLKGDHVTREQAKLSWQAFDTHQPVILDDYSKWEYRRDIYDTQSLHATVDFPVMAGDRCLGILALGRSQSNYSFTAEQIETGILFARLVALVLDNANLYESAMSEIAERNRVEEALLNQNQYLGALQKTTFEMLQSRDVASLLNTITAEATSLVGAQYGDIFLSEGDELVLRATNMLSIAKVGSREKKPAAGLLGQVWRTMKPLAVENYSEWEDRDSSYSTWSLRAVAGVPIIGRDGPLGVLEVARMNDNSLQFAPQEIDVFEQFAALASLVLDNAQLYASAQNEITEREHTEALLLESEARFRQIVENASDIIYRADLKGNFTYANPSALRMLGYASEHEVLDKNYLEMTTPEFRHKLKRVYDHQYLSKTKNTYYEFPAVAVDGQIVWVGQNVQLIMDGDKITGFQAVGRDVTQLKQAQEALALSRDQALDASRFKSQLLSRVSHELRTPLGGILGYAELLEFKAFGSLTEKQRHAVSNIIESTNYLTNIVNDLLDESQIQSKSKSLQNEYFNLVELLEKTKTTMSVLAAKKGLTFRVEIDPELPSELYGDVNRLQQILVNLAGNAIKFTREGEVSVSVKRPAPAHWSIQVCDTGAGISRSEHETIFEPFRQVNNSITRENRGSGLGLAITRQLVELMDGHISLESEIGKGSLFTITLPITNAPGE